MAATATVEVKNLDKVLRKLRTQYGATAVQRTARPALDNAARNVVKPAIRNAAPPSDPNAPYRRRKVAKASDQRFPGPMRDKVYVKYAKKRPDEVVAVRVGIKTAHTSVVIRGARPHDIPNWFGNPNATYRHRGARSNDIIGRAMSNGLDKRVTRQVERDVITLFRAKGML